MTNLLKHPAPRLRKYGVFRAKNLNAAAFSFGRALVKKTTAVKEKIESKLSSVCGQKLRRATRFREEGGFY